MQKVISLSLFILLTLNVSVFAFESKKQPEADINTKQANEVVSDYDFDENSFNISDEQFKSSITTSGNLLEEKTDFRTRIINSSHFTPNSPYKNARGSREENRD